MNFDEVAEKAKGVLMKQLDVLENGNQMEKETAIRMVTAVSEMLKVIL